MAQHIKHPERNLVILGLRWDDLLTSLENGLNQTSENNETSTISFAIVLFRAKLL